MRSKDGSLPSDMNSAEEGRCGSDDVGDESDEVRPGRRHAATSSESGSFAGDESGAERQLCRSDEAEDEVEGGMKSRLDQCGQDAKAYHDRYRCQLLTGDAE